MRHQYCLLSIFLSTSTNLLQVVDGFVSQHQNHYNWLIHSTSDGGEGDCQRRQSSSIVPLELNLLHHPTSRKQFLSKVICTTTKITASTAVGIAATTTATATAVPQSAKATYIDPKTKINLPSVGEIEEAMPSNWDDIDNPFILSNNNNKKEQNDALFDRLDNTNDFLFYNEPRFVEHIDENAVSILQDYISNKVLGPNMDVLDLCSSWTSHFSAQTKDKLNLHRVAGLGMNEEELKANPVLTDYTLMNLNIKKPSLSDSDGSKHNIRLPYDDSSFDVVLCQLSIDYLIYPLDVMKEVGRVLKKGGKVVVLFSNRLFIQKAVGIWTGADDVDHAFIVGSYMFYSNSGLVPRSIESKDLSRRDRKGQIIGDPVYVVTATKG